MTTPTSTAPAITGGIWLLEDPAAIDIFTPERLTDEHRLIDQTAEAFVSREVMPNHDQLETKDWDLARRLVCRCGDLGLLGTDVPEAYGGVGLDKASSVVVGSRIGQSGSFGSTFGSHSGLTIFPLVCFGTETQKQRYLSKLVSGEWVGAYCLSESGSGSDALGAKARATRQDDGSYMLSGEKMWITNGGFADLFVVFAKVDGEHFTAFLVERSYPGVSSGKEEHKMGLHGSSTTPVILQDVRDTGRQRSWGGRKRGTRWRSIPSTTAGSSWRWRRTAAPGSPSVKLPRGMRPTAISSAAPIASFGAIKYKLGEMAVRAFAVESMIYRTTGLLDAALAGHDLGRPDTPAPDAGRAGGRMFDSQGRRQRDGRLRARRERPDPWRQRIRQGLSGRAALPRRAGESHLRRHERDQPAADSRHPDSPRPQGRSAVDCRRQSLQDEIMAPPSLPEIVRRPASTTSDGPCPPSRRRRSWCWVWPCSDTVRS